MTLPWPNSLLIVLPLLGIPSMAAAQNPVHDLDKDKKSTVPVASAPAPTGMPTPVAKPVLLSGVPTGTTAAAAKPPAQPAAPGSTPASPPAPAAAKPAPELDQLKFLLGKWRCEGRQFASPLSGPEHAFKAVAENKADLDGFWDQFTYEEKKSKDHHGFKVHGLWGWDQADKHLVRAAASTDGNWDSANSPGLEGDQVVWTGEFSGPMGRLPFKHTFVKKSDKEWTHTLDIKDPTGKWTPSEEATCRR
jgi:hypothetical protein